MDAAVLYPISYCSTDGNVFGRPDVGLHVQRVGRNESGRRECDKMQEIFLGQVSEGAL